MPPSTHQTAASPLATGIAIIARVLIYRMEARPNGAKLETLTESRCDGFDRKHSAFTGQVKGYARILGVQEEQNVVNHKQKTALALCCSLIGPGIASADTVWTEQLGTMINDGKVNIDLRYRNEYVDQDGFDESAMASTLRSRITLASAALHGFSVKAEFDDITVIGSEQYNSTANGETQYPVVADPEGFDVNQALIHYQGETFGSTYGRQRINHGNQRFIGGVGWRQNEQTYDGFRTEWQAADQLKVDYSYIYNVSRIFGPDKSQAQPSDLKGQNHLLRIDYALSETQKLAAFGYFLEFDSRRDPSGNPYAAGKTVDNSTDTWGLEYSGKFDLFTVKAAVATQSDAGDSTKSYRAEYYALDVSATIAAIDINGGIEVLGAGDDAGGTGFKTPLATLHKFQGWADKFLTTPNGGIEDIYLGVGGSLGPVKLKAVYHDFSADEDHGFRDYGSEIDLAASWPITKGFSAALHYANFDTDDESFAKDAEKIWLTVQLKI